MSNGPVARVGQVAARGPSQEQIRGEFREGVAASDKFWIEMLEAHHFLDGSLLTDPLFTITNATHDPQISQSLRRQVCCC